MQAGSGPWLDRCRCTCSLGRVMVPTLAGGQKHHLCSVLQDVPRGLVPVQSCTGCCVTLSLGQQTGLVGRAQVQGQALFRLAFSSWLCCKARCPPIRQHADCWQEAATCVFAKFSQHFAVQRLAKVHSSKASDLQAVAFMLKWSITLHASLLLLD